jgi:hypothetical protein
VLVPAYYWAGVLGVVAVFVCGASSLYDLQQNAFWTLQPLSLRCRMNNLVLFGVLWGLYSLCLL